MKIIKEDQARLEIKHSRIVAVSVGVIFVCIGILMFVNPTFMNDVPWFIGIAFLACGLLSILLPSSEAAIFDKEKNKLNFVTKSFVKTSASEYDLVSVQEVDLWIEADTSSGKGWHFLLGCTLKDGTRVILNESHPAKGTRVSVGSISHTFLPERKIGERLAAFLGVPFVEKQPPTLSEALSQATGKIEEMWDKYQEKKKTD